MARRGLAAVALTSIALVGVACGRQETLSQRVVGTWDCRARDTGGQRQTTWSAPCRAEYRANGTWSFTEDNILESGTYEIFEAEGAMAEEVKESGVKERVGHKSRCLVTVVADQMMMVYEPNAAGGRTTLMYVRVAK
jgi:hypothetical protein